MSDPQFRAIRYGEMIGYWEDVMRRSWDFFQRHGTEEQVRDIILIFLIEKRRHMDALAPQERFVVDDVLRARRV